MTPFEQYGLRNIQHASGRVKDPIFQTLLVVQPVAEGIVSMKTIYYSKLALSLRTSTQEAPILSTLMP